MSEELIDFVAGRARELLDEVAGKAASRRGFPRPRDLLEHEAVLNEEAPTLVASHVLLDAFAAWLVTHDRTSQRTSAKAPIQKSSVQKFTSSTSSVSGSPIATTDRPDGSEVAEARFDCIDRQVVEEQHRRVGVLVAQLPVLVEELDAPEWRADRG